MLKHTTPRSSPSLSSNSSFLSRSTTSETPVKNDKICFSNATPTQLSGEKSYNLSDSPNGSFSERSIDCEGILKSVPLQKKRTPAGLGILLGEKILGIGTPSIVPVITQGRAIVKRGLSFNKKESLSTVTKNEPTPKTTSLTQPFSSQLASHKHENDDNASNKTVTKDPFLQKLRAASSDSKTQQNKKTQSKHDAPTLQSLLRLPGVYGHIPVSTCSPSKYPNIVSLDSLSLNSGNSLVSSNSGRNSARSWSSNTSSISQNTKESCTSNCSSSSEPSSTTMKVYAKCLRSDIEYKTLSVGPRVTCRELINELLSKARMRHRDPNLFYLTMEVTARRWSGLPVRALLVLEDQAKPAQLALCRPPGDLQFALQMKRGGVIKVQDTILMSQSQYKSLLVSYRTNAEEVIQLLLNCCGKRESKHFYALHEVRISPTFKDRRINSEEKPLEVKSEWPRDRAAEFVFVLRRNMTQAFSLRKLSMQSSEMPLAVLTAKTELSLKATGESSTTVATPGNSKTTTQYEESVIDCTSTIPVVKTVIREEKSYDLWRFSGARTAEKLLANLKQATLLTNNFKTRSKVSGPYTKPALPLRAKHDLINNSKPAKVTNLCGEGRLENISEEMPNNGSTSATEESQSNPNMKSEVKKLQSDAQTQTCSIKDDLVLDHATDTVPQNSIVSDTSVSDEQQKRANEKQLTNFEKTINKYNNILSKSSFRAEIKYLSIKGSFESTHRWNSVEALLDSFNNKSAEAAPISQSHKKSFEQCEQNCHNCFYI